MTTLELFWCGRAVCLEGWRAHAAVIAVFTCLIVGAFVTVATICQALGLVLA
jgi:hypothetical protein